MFQALVCFSPLFGVSICKFAYPALNRSFPLVPSPLSSVMIKPELLTMQVKREEAVHIKEERKRLRLTLVRGCGVSAVDAHASAVAEAHDKTKAEVAAPAATTAPATAAVPDTLAAPATTTLVVIDEPSPPEVAHAAKKLKMATAGTDEQAGGKVLGREYRAGKLSLQDVVAKAEGAGLRLKGNWQGKRDVDDQTKCVICSESWSLEHPFLVAPRVPYSTMCSCCDTAGRTM